MPPTRTTSSPRRSWPRLNAPDAACPSKNWGHPQPGIRERGVPVIYVNDNFGEWRSHHGEILDIALAGAHADLVEPLRPDDESLFVVKARHSIFYETPLAYLLNQLDVRHIILCGQVTEQCVLYSALDAHIRHVKVTVPQDAVAHIHDDLAEAALRMMERNLGTTICSVDSLFL
ncbi:cysteine hydrolase family protein [Streptomyces sp. Tue6028]|uniref:cysteine hydrolase family protein n=1 Tax=Streptomyces sp. Tue6028 TaxID=2036037 RepID=UPI003D7530F5